MSVSAAPALLQVKNIDEIQLGMHEMDTWYFSPLPPEYKDCKVGGWVGGGRWVVVPKWVSGWVGN